MSDTLVFTGWTRTRGQLWEAVIIAATESEAWDLLHRHVDRLGVKNIDLFVGAGVDPRGRRWPQPAQRGLFQ